MDFQIHQAFPPPAQSSQDAPPTQHPSQQPPAPTNPKLRKRTKTGCLTCRRRRIKCGEERPTCNNCQKSKRHCEGYNQRVIFKSPIGNWPSTQHGGETTLQFHSSMLPGTARPGYARGAPPPPLPLDAANPNIPSAPAGAFHTLYNGFIINENVPMIPIQPTTPIIPAIPMSAGPFMSLGPNGAPIYTQQTQFSATISQPAHFQYGYQQHQVPLSTAFAHSFDQTTLPQQVSPPSSNEKDPEDDVQEVVQQQQDVYGSHGHRDSFDHVLAFTPIRPIATEDIVLASGEPEHVFVNSPNELLEGAAVENHDDDYYDVQSEDEFELHSDDEMDEDIPAGGLTTQRPDMGATMTVYRQHISDLHVRSFDAFLFDGVLDQYRAEQHANPLKNPRTARVFAHFIHAVGPSLGIFERNPRDSSAIFGYHPLHKTQQSIWTYALPMLALNNQGLLHAMLALASLHIANLQNASATPSLKHYTFAIKRIHAAVGSNLKRHNITTLAATLLLGYYEVMSADHAKWCSHLGGARQLLSEIDFPTVTVEARRMRAEQEAKEQNPDFHGFSIARLNPQPSPTLTNRHNIIDERLVSTIIGHELRYDEMGRVIGEVDDSNAQQPGSKLPSYMDLALYDLYQDLWWWFARQDAYQSIVSGNRLLMDYRRWSDCPPRTGMGKKDAAYGAHDHIILLLGRLADFGARDRKRKLRYWKVNNNGQWKPPPRFEFEGLPKKPPPPGMGPPPGAGGPPTTTGGGTHAPQKPSHTAPNEQGSAFASQGASQHPSHPAAPRMGGSPQPPPQVPFMGMAPSANKTYMPTSYAIYPNQLAHPESPASPESTSSSQEEEALHAAMQEWYHIRSALKTLHSRFGSSFMPYPAFAMAEPGSHTQEAMINPFGEAICYTAFDVAVLNALYQMSQIILIRSHPQMPPASMIAAGVARPFTEESANLIGRITAGIFAEASSFVNKPGMGFHDGSEEMDQYLSKEKPPLNPSIGGMLCEMTMPMFFAGVQLQTQEQRRWLIDHLREVEERAGWATAGIIGHGCETSWVRTAAAGRGPPYERAGYWGKSPHSTPEVAGMRDKDTAKRYQKTTWGVGVRGFEGDEPPGVGLKAEEDEEEEDKLRQAPPLPVRSRSIGFGQDERITLGDGGAEQMRRAAVAADSSQRAHWAMGLLSNEEDVE